MRPNPNSKSLAVTTAMTEGPLPFFSRVMNFVRSTTLSKLKAEFPALKSQMALVTWAYSGCSLQNAEKFLEIAVSPDCHMAASRILIHPNVVIHWILHAVNLIQHRRMRRLLRCLSRSVDTRRAVGVKTRLCYVHGSGTRQRA